MAELNVRYATALYDLALESGKVDEYQEQAAFLRDVLQTSECQNIMEHPSISFTDKRAFFEKAFSGSIHDDLMGFLFLVVAKSRESFLIPALTSFIDMVNRYKRKTTAEVVSATELGSEQISALEALLSKKLDKQVDIALRVDPSVIGGLCIHVDGYFIDRTIKRRLYDMKVSIKRSVPNDSQA